MKSSVGQIDPQMFSRIGRFPSWFWDVFDLIHSYDWYASGDTCKETYLKDKAEFKKKWFSNRGVRVRAIVDGALSDVRRELYETFGFPLEPEEVPK